MPDISGETGDKRRESSEVGLAGACIAGDAADDKRNFHRRCD